MGCEVVVRGDADGVAALFAEWDARFSRFRPHSELSRVNAAAAEAVWVSEPFAAALRVALAAWEQTDGLVDPTLGAAIVAAGYDRDFAALVDDGPCGAAAPSRAREIGLSGRLLRRPPGLALDLNGVVKALAVDAAAARLRGDGFVSAGGDLAARGPVDVALPGGGAVRLVAGALATSSTAVRRWRRDGAWQHHLIDPRTGRPARTPWVTVTACGASCVAADVAVKAGLLAGPEWLEARGIPARLVAHDGEVTLTAGWEAAVCT
jgi:thiamine biosynthesis lipoprotein